MGKSINRTHKRHYQLIDNKAIVSFNPEVISVEKMLKGEYTIMIDNRLPLSMPVMGLGGKMICTAMEGFNYNKGFHKNFG